MYMIKKILVCLLINLVINSTAQVVPNIDWVKTFNPRFQRANAPSALDANNNVYVTGYVSTSASNQDLVVLKYDSLGILLWSYIYDNGGNDAGKAIKVSSTGNVYVTGQSYDASSNFDYYTIKLSPTGSVIWSARYDYSGSTDAAVDIKIDEPAAKVYVTGSGFNGSDNDIITLLYDDSNGSLVWNNVYDGGVSGNDDAVGLVIVDNGNFLMIAGNCINSSGNYDIAAINIKNDGSPNWSYYTDGTAGTNDNAKAIIATGANVAICGMVNNNSSNQDYATIVIDALTPSLIWQNNYDVSNGIQSATSLVNDSTGNIAVTGYAVNSGIYEYHTILYSPAGTQLFTNVESTGINNLYIEPRVATDTIAHHFYVSGAKLNTNNDVFVYQIAPSGNTKWREYHNGSSNLGDAATGLVVNGIGVVYLSALSLNTSGNWDIVTMKISQTPVYFPIDLVATNNDKSFLFYENIGQELDINKNVITDYKYITHSSPKLYLKPTQLSMVFASGSSTNNIIDTIHRIDIAFNKANPLTQLYSFEDYGSNVSYLLGQLGSPSNNQKGKQRLMVPNLYHNVDLHYYSNRNGGLKYYFVVKPGADPNVINHILNSTNYSSTITPSGNLKITSSVGFIELEKPLAYQVNMFGQAVPISGTSSWSALSSSSYKFSLPTYTTSLPLIILINQSTSQSIISSTNISVGNLKWSTFIGGESDDQAFSVAVDKAGNQHVAGSTSSINFPTFGFQVLASPTIATNSRYGFYCKFDSLHDRKLFAYIGGNDQTDAYAVSTNNSNDAYIVGTTQATNFLTLSKIGAYNDNTIGSTASNAKEDGFIIKFNSLEQYTWGTYFGGTNNDQARNCTIDGNNNLYLTGGMRSVAMPLVPNGSAYQQNWAGSNDGFIGKFNSADSLVWFTYYGSNLSDVAYSCKTNSSNDLFITGYTYSSNFPTYRQNSAMYKDSTLSGITDLFILKFNSAGVRQWATLYGGNNYEYTSYLPTNNCIAFDASQNVYIGGSTQSTDLFTKKLSNIAYYDSTFGGNIDAFLLRFDANQQLQFSSYIGGNNYDVANSLAVDKNNNLYLNFGTGTSGLNTSSLGNSYIQNSLNNATPAINLYSVDNFILSLNPNLTQRFATYFGGSSYNAQGDEGMAVAIDNNKMYIAGYCNSYNSNVADVRFPIFYPGVPAYIDSTYNDISQANSADAFISLFDLSTVVGISELSKNEQNLMQVYPNPSNNNFNVMINCTEPKQVKFALYNIEGKLLFSKEVQLIYGNNIIPFYTNGLPSGIYLLNLNGENFNSSSKLIKNE